MAKVPNTVPSADRIGVDQQARRPCAKGRSRYAAHSGSAAMSETITGAARYAAVMHDPPVGPMATPSMASMYLCGRRGAAPWRQGGPGASNHKKGGRQALGRFSTHRPKGSPVPGD